MRVFKTTYKTRKGKTREAAKWYVEIKDQLDTVRRLPAFTSKAASEEMGRNLEKLVGYHKGTGGQVDPSLSRWLTTLPVKTREKLVEIGLLAPDRASVAKSLIEHLADFEVALQAKGGTIDHVAQTVERVRRILQGCGFRYFPEISSSRVLSFLAGLREGSAKRKGISAQTYNYYASALKQFCRWLVRERRAPKALSPISVRSIHGPTEDTIAARSLPRSCAASDGDLDRARAVRDDGSRADYALPGCRRDRSPR